MIDCFFKCDLKKYFPTQWPKTGMSRSWIWIPDVSWNFSSFCWEIYSCDRRNIPMHLFIVSVKYYLSIQARNFSYTHVQCHFGIYIVTSLGYMRHFIIWCVYIILYYKSNSVLHDHNIFISYLFLNVENIWK